jgi:hypothetical protein
MCSMARVPAEKHIDRLVELSFAAIDSGNLQPPEKSLFLVVTDEIKNEIETKK